MTKRTKKSAAQNPTPGNSANDRTIEIAMPESGTAEEAKETLAKGIPGWDELTKEQQTELAEIDKQLADPRGYQDGPKMKTLQGQRRRLSLTLEPLESEWARRAGG